MIVEFSCLMHVLALCILIHSSVWLDTIKLGWSIVHIWECQVRILLLPGDLFFTFTNSIDPGYAVFHLDLLCLQKYSFWVF